MVVWLIGMTIVLPWIGAVGVLAARDRRPRAQACIAVCFSAAAGGAALALAAYASPAISVALPAGGVFGDFTFTPDGFGVLFASIATIVGSLAVLFSVDYMRGEAQLGRYYALMLLFIGAMAGLVLTSSLLLLFLFWEIVALCSYALIAFRSDDPKAAAGGIKALIITQVGGIGLLAGILIVYASLGTYDIATFLAQADRVPPGALAAAAFGFLAAAAAKSAQVPFHTWLPDAMEAPTPVSALIHAATMVNAGVYLLARFFPAFTGVPLWQDAVIAVGVASAALGAVMALTADDIKRVLAYSTISQLGFLTYAVGVGAAFAAQFHLMSHAVFKALLFLAAGAVIHVAHTREMRRIAATGARMPLVRAAFVTGALALAGVPVLNGFWSKDLLLDAGFAAGGSSGAVMLAVAALTAAYAARVSAIAFFGRARPDDAAPAEPIVINVPAATRVPLGALMAATLTTWLLAGPLAGVLARTLPAHAVPAVATRDVVAHVLGSPVLLGALAATGAGAAAWIARARLLKIAAFGRAAGVIGRASAADFGFVAVNDWIVVAARRGVRAAGGLQTGHVNWNVAGVVIALALMLAWLAMRG
jgi:NADH-quinone oxidoreductase subunit L